MRIAALDRAALALGLTQGMSLADARARVPELAAHPHDPAADARLLERVADLCDRYTPMAAIDPPDAVILDITGCAHLFGSEAALAEDAVARLERIGLGIRSARAAAPSAALALARFGGGGAANEDEALRRLPVAALGLEGEAAVALRRAGLKTIGDLAGRPTMPLSARFGAAATAALDRMLGRADSRIDPRRPLPALSFARRFAEPIARTEDAIQVLGDLAEEGAAAMEERRRGGRRFAARLYRSDGAVRDLAIETGRPVRDPAVLIRLFEERIAGLADPIDPGFGFDMIRLSIPALEPLAPEQLRLEGGSAAEDARAALIDRLATRFGRESILHLAPRNSHVPEQAALALPAVEAPDPLPWPRPEEGEPPLRPIHLFDPPQRIEVIAEVPAGPPRRFRWRRALHDVTLFEGPERIAAEWWRGRGAGRTRDYYRVEDARGRRFWIFRHGLYGGKAEPVWYLHGLFA